MKLGQIAVTAAVFVALAFGLQTATDFGSLDQVFWSATSTAGAAPEPELSDEELAVVDWMIERGAPADFSVAQETVIYPGGSYKNEYLIFRRQGKAVTLSLRLALHSPDIALLDIGRELAIPMLYEPYRRSGRVTLPVKIRPVGEAIEGEPGRFQQARGDDSPEGAEYEDASGRYVKRSRTRFAFFRSFYWEKVE